MNRSKMRSRNIYALILLSLAITFTTALFIHYKGVVKAGDTEKVINTHRTIYSGNQLVRKLQSLQRAQRNFLVTEDSLHHASYRSLLNEMDAYLQDLQLSLTPDEHNRLLVEQHLIPAIEEKKKELDSSLIIYEDKGQKAALELIDISRREYNLTVIEDLLNQLLSDKEHQLIEQAETLEGSYNSYNGAVYAGLFLITIVIVMAFRVISQQAEENETLVGQLTKKNRSLVIRHDHEAEMSREKTKSINYAAHDLRSPLNAITSIAELAQRGDEQLSTEQQEYWHLINEAGEQMASLINNLLDVKKIESGTSDKPKLEETNISGVVKDIAKGFENHAGDKNITLELRTESSMTCYIDKAMFSQIVENLLSNAIKFSPHDSTVTVTVRSKEDSFAFKISDEGPGIKKSEMKDLYTPFESLSAKPTGRETSIGLGLPIVKDRVEVLGGSIDCRSTSGKGTTFFVELPYHSQ